MYLRSNSRWRDWHDITKPNDTFAVHRNKMWVARL